MAQTEAPKAEIPDDVFRTAWDETYRSKHGIPGPKAFYRIKRERGIKCTLRRGPAPAWQEHGSTRRALTNAVEAGDIAPRTGRKWLKLVQNRAHDRESALPQKRSRLCTIYSVRLRDWDGLLPILLTCSSASG